MIFKGDELMDEQDFLLHEILEAIKNEDAHALRTFLEEIHPYDMAQALLQMDEDERILFRKLTDEELADLIEELDYEEQQSLLQKMGPTRGIRIIEKMAPDDAADYLGELEKEERAEIIAKLSPDFAADINQLLNYPENSAGGLMTTEFFVLYAHNTHLNEVNLHPLTSIPDAFTNFFRLVFRGPGKNNGKFITTPSGNDVFLAAGFHQYATDLNEHFIAFQMSKNIICQLQSIDIPYDNGQRQLSLRVHPADFFFEEGSVV